jgi:UDP-GlcNAc3NAcA epimerase
MIKIATIVGARPQFVKAATISREIAKNKGIKEIIIHTGQHYDQNMSDIFFDEMQIPKPDYFLGINGLSHGAMTGQMMEQIEKVLQSEKPDWVIVFGDTNSTLAGALAAKKLHIRLAHIEAGLRSFNMNMPEEINRILTDRISDILFCPTENAVKNLIDEGFSNFGCQIIKSGDVMYDAALFYEKISEEKSKILNTLKINHNEFDTKDYILCTLHREENTDDPERLNSILESLNTISNETSIVLPLHPRTRKRINSLHLEYLLHSKNIFILEPVGYFDMIQLIKNSQLVMTDSGGLQKEAYFFKKFCITLRTETEWIELVENGINKISGYKKEDILENYFYFRKKNSIFVSDLYGDGKSSAKILKLILKSK